MKEGATRGWKAGEWKKTGVKLCRRCHQVKPVTEFYLMKNTGYLDPRCKLCATIRRAEHRKSHRHDYIRYRRKRNLKNYGLSEADYQEIVRQQGGGCAICGSDETLRNRRLAVDHCHEEGHVRGILCGRCNTAIGYFGESLRRMQRAMEYLRKHGATWP